MYTQLAVSLLYESQLQQAIRTVQIGKINKTEEKTQWGFAEKVKHRYYLAKSRVSHAMKLKFDIFFTIATEKNSEKGQENHKKN